MEKAVNQLDFMINVHCRRIRKFRKAKQTKTPWASLAKIRTTNILMFIPAELFPKRIYYYIPIYVFQYWQPPNKVHERNGECKKFGVLGPTAGECQGTKKCSSPKSDLNLKEESQLWLAPLGPLESVGAVLWLQIWPLRRVLVPTDYHIPCFPFVLFCFICLFVCLFLVICLFRAVPKAYGSSQARGPIGAEATSLHHNHSNARSKLCLWPTPQLMALPDL